MGFRFRRSIKLLPGIRLNLSKSGVSATVGKPGVSINISERGTRGTVGLPGTGLSYSTKLSPPMPYDTNQTDHPSQAAPTSGAGRLLAWALLLALFVALLFMGRG